MKHGKDSSFASLKIMVFVGSINDHDERSSLSKSFGRLKSYQGSATCLVNDRRNAGQYKRISCFKVCTVVTLRLSINRDSY